MMKISKVYSFFKDKEHAPSPITDRLVESGYSQKSGGYKKKALDLGLIKNMKETPSQWWHLMESYLPTKKKEDQFPRSVQCGELLIWMAEVSESVSKKELNDLVDEVIQNKYARKIGNIKIRDTCFDATKDKVKEYSKSMKEVIFTTKMNDDIIKIIIDFENNSVSVCEVDKEREQIANLFLEGYRTLTYKGLEDKLSFYMDGDYELPLIINHIEEKGFYTPYVPNLRVIVKDYTDK